MPDVVQRLSVEVTGDTNDAERKLNGLGDGASKWGGRLATAGAAAFASVGVAAGAFAFKAIQGASDLNEQVSKTGVVFGDAAKIVTGGADQMAKSFGIPKATFIEAAGAIGLIGKASGLTQVEAAKLGTNMGKLAADASSFYNVPLPDALQAIQSGLVGEAEPLRKYGVLLSEDAVKAEALRLGLVTTAADTSKMSAAAEKLSLAQLKARDATQKFGEGSVQARTAALAVTTAQQALEKASAGVKVELTEGQKVQARTSLITKGMTDASGDLERTQGSLANRLREVQGRAMNFAAEVGTGLIPIVLTAFDTFEKWGATLSGVLMPVLKKLAGGVRAFVGAFKAGGDDVTSSGLAGKLEGFGLTARHVFDTLSDVAAKVGPPLIAFGKAVGNVLGALASTIFPLLGDAVGFVAPILAEIAAITLPAMTAALNIVAPVIRSVGNFIQTWETPLTIIAALIGVTMIPKLVAWAAQTVATGVVNSFWWLANKTDAIASGAAQLLAGGQVVAGWVMGAAGALVNGAIIVGQWVLMGLEAMANAAIVAAAWLIAAGPIILVVAAVIGLAVAIVKNWDTIKDAVSAGAKWVGDRLSDVAGFFLDLPGMIWNAVSGAVGWLVNTGSDIITGLLDGMGAVLGGVWDFISGIATGIWNIVAGAGEWLLNTGKNIMNGLLNGISASFGRLWDFINDIPKGIWKMVEGAGEWLVQTGKNIIIGLWNGIAELGGDWLIDRVKDLVRGAIINPVKWVLGIASPSRVMAEMGKNLGLGLAAGILGTTGLVSDASAKLADAASTEVTMGASFKAPGLRGPGTPSTASAVGMTGTTIHAPITIHEVPQGEGEAVASEIAAKLSRVRMKG